MSVSARIHPIAALAAALLCAATAQAEPTDTGTPPAAARPGKKSAPEALPEPALRLRVVAPSAKGLWTLHLENEGDRWLRVPADLRLLRLSVESGDTMAKRPAKPALCATPAGLRSDAYPEHNSLLLGPGDSYVEAFDPRLFCFGKAAAAVEGGALVRARYGWDLPARGAKKVTPPFVVEGTTFPAAVEPKKVITAPALVLSWRPPEVDDESETAKADAADIKADAEEAEPAGADKDEKDKADKDKADKDKADKDKADKDKADKDKADKPPPLPVDENAPRFELHASPYIDAANAHRVAVTLTVTNVGHRAAIAAVRGRMFAFRVDGPDGIVRCHSAAPSHSLPRDAYSTIKPGGSTAVTLLVEEACGHDLFRRPGLYHVLPSVHLNETGTEVGLTALTGSFHAREPTLVRIAEGPEPFYKRAPQPIRAHHEAPEKPEDKPPPAPEDTREHPTP
jgi:hypothetical protein